jgi:hypothetical protein
LRISSSLGCRQHEKDYGRFETQLRELIELVGRKERRFPQHTRGAGRTRPTRPWKTVSGAVQKILKGVYQNNAEHVEITIPEAEDLFREIRIENKFTDLDGEPVALKGGAHVDVTFEADAKDTVKTGNGQAA